MMSSDTLFYLFIERTNGNLFSFNALFGNSLRQRLPYGFSSFYYYRLVDPIAGFDGESATEHFHGMDIDDCDPWCECLRET